jgi:hypothetical protein
MSLEKSGFLLAEEDDTTANFTILPQENAKETINQTLRHKRGQQYLLDLGEN